MVKVEGDATNLTVTLDKFKGELNSWKSLGSFFQEVFRGEEQEVFRTEGFGEWPELSPVYAEWKEAHYPFMGIMQRERHLEFSLTRQTGDTIAEYGDKEFTFGSTVPYGRAHMKPYRNRPARPPIILRREGVEKYLKVLQRGGVTKARRVNRAWVQTEIEEFGTF
jgi:phage gpG-like protein